MENKTLFKIVGGAIALIVFAILSTSLVEEIDAGEIVVIQAPVTGKLSVYTKAGYVWQGGGKATHYKRENQFYFLSTRDKIKAGIRDTTDNAVNAIWNDNGKSSISGSIRWTMPSDTESIIKLHSNFGTQDQIEQSLIRTNVVKSVFHTGPIMSSRESYAEKRGDLISLIQDQINYGVYRTKVVERDVVDELTGETRTQNVVEIIESEGIKQRQEESPIQEYNLRLYNVAVTSITYDDRTEDQIGNQQDAYMAVQTAIANSKKAEQDLITTQKQGEAAAAKAKWEIEVEKAKLVTEAETRRAVAEENLKTAGLNKQADILEGQGIAEKKRLVMQADGALNEKLQAWIKSQEFMWAAFAQYKGNIVPLYQTGAGGGSNAINFMEIMGAKAAKDLALDLSNK